MASNRRWGAGRVADETVRVEAARDVRDAHAGIDGRAVATIRALLDERDAGATVLWVAEWLCEEPDKPLTPAAGHPQVLVGAVVGETDKAWRIDQPATDADPVWLPKSESRVFRLAADATTVDGPQQRLTDAFGSGRCGD